MAKTVASLSAGPFTAPLDLTLEPLATRWRALARRVRSLALRDQRSSSALVHRSSERDSVPDRPSQAELQEMLKAGL